VAWYYLDRLSLHHQGHGQQPKAIPRKLFDIAAFDRLSDKLTHMFSKYAEASEVMWNIIDPATQAESIPDVRGGHSLDVNPEPIAPPIRTWQSHIAADPGLLASKFHSTAIKPFVSPKVVNKRSCISTEPLSPCLPTWTMGRGFVSSEKFGP
jgi:hypothetical protein